MLTLSREEADALLRRLANTYYEETVPDGELAVDNTEPRFGDFVHDLSCRLGVNLDKDFVLDVLYALDSIAKAQNPADEEEAMLDLDHTVSAALKNVHGSHSAPPAFSPLIPHSHESSHDSLRDSLPCHQPAGR